MAKTKQLETFQRELGGWLHLEHDFALSEALGAAIQLTEVLGSIIQTLEEKDDSLRQRYKRAAKAAGEDNVAALAILQSAEKVMSAEDPALPDLLWAWHTLDSKPHSYARQLWFGTEAFAAACYRQSIRQQLQLLDSGVLVPPEDPMIWQQMERQSAALVSAAGAAGMLAQRARSYSDMEEQVGFALCSNLERLAGVAASLHLLCTEWTPTEEDVRHAGDMLTRLQRFFQRAQLWVDEAVRLLEAPVGYRPPS